MTPILGQSALVTYALMLGAGGFMGYRKAGSKPSLIAGTTAPSLRALRRSYPSSIRSWGSGLARLWASSCWASFCRDSSKPRR